MRALDRGTPRAKARLAALTALALLTTSIGLAGPVAAAPPAHPPSLVNDAGDTGGQGSGPASVRHLGHGPADALGPSGRSYVPGVVLVGYRDGASAAERGAARRAAKAQSHRSVSKLAPGLERLRLEPGTSVESAVRALQGRKGVRFAEPDYTITTDFEPNDAIYSAGLMWGLYGLNSNPPSAYG